MELQTSEFARAIGATPRQVIHWTENMILWCLPGTNRKGTGNHRRYGEDEVAFGRLVRVLSQFGLTAGQLQAAAFTVRGRVDVANPDPDHRAKWLAALRGETKTYLAIGRPENGEVVGMEFVLTNQEELANVLPSPAAIVINLWALARE